MPHCLSSLLLHMILFAYDLCLFFYLDVFCASVFMEIKLNLNLNLKLQQFLINLVSLISRNALFMNILCIDLTIELLVFQYW